MPTDILPPIAGANAAGPSWLSDPRHRDFLRADAAAQLAFFRASPRAGGGFHTLDLAGKPRDSDLQELHTTTRLVHAFALGVCAGFSDCKAVIDQGMAYLWSHHRDARYGGYLWGCAGSQIADARKLAYGHVFVLLAASSARLVGHPDADRLLGDVAEVLEARFWEDQPGLFADEFNRDWTPFSTYRGMNANMHGVEALLAAHEATGEGVFLHRAGRILDFLAHRMAPRHGWRIPEHYTEGWQVDPEYAGDPMFRPAGTTPGHALEVARLILQHRDQAGRKDDTESLGIARILTIRALHDAWHPERGGLAYSLHADGTIDVAERYWWPVTEAIGATAAFLKLGPDAEIETWYRRLWAWAAEHLIDRAHGGWFSQVDAHNRPTSTQFAGKPDIYHTLQAVLFPLVPEVSGIATALRRANWHPTAP